MENDRPIKALAAELTDMAAWIENTKPQGVLYDSVLPSMREAAAAITRLEGERDDALKDNKKLRMMMEAREKLQDAFGVDMHQNATETALEFAQREIEAVARAEAAEATLAEATSATMMAEMRADKWKAEVERLKSDIAAPAMLEALRSAAAFIGEEADNREYAGSEHSDYEREPRDLVNRINAAIALATG